MKGYIATKGIYSIVLVFSNHSAHRWRWCLENSEPGTAGVLDDKRNPDQNTGISGPNVKNSNFSAL